MPSRPLRITLPDDTYEELVNLGEYYQVGPETLAGQLLRGLLQPLAAAGVLRGPVAYAIAELHRREEERAKYLFRVNWICDGSANASEDDCFVDTNCTHTGSWWRTSQNMFRCNDCGLFFRSPYDSDSLLSYAEQRLYGSPAV